QLGHFRNDVKGRTGRNFADSDDGGTEWRRFAADERLQGCDDMGSYDNWIDRCFRHGGVSAFALYANHNLVSAGKDGTGTYANATQGVITDEMQADYTVHTFHSSLFHHRLRSTNDLLGGLKDKFDVARQFLAAFG